MLPAHRVGSFWFQFWEGDPPEPALPQVEISQRAGVDGTAFRLLGRRGRAFEAQLTQHFASYFLARLELLKYYSAIGVGAVEVWHEFRRLAADWRTVYVVEAVREVECRVNVRLVGPGYNFAAGAALVTRWRLVPVSLD